MKTSRPTAFTLLVLLAALPAPAVEEAHLYCHHGQALLAADISMPRQYAPDREVDILHVAIEVTPDWKQRTIDGVTTIRFKPIAKPLGELKLDGIDLRLEAVSSTEKLLGYHASDRQVVMTFEPPIPADREASVTIRYQAQPRDGLFFRTPEMGYKPEDMHLWTQGEPVSARHWFPCFDSPNEKFTSEVTCRVPEGMVVLSNGKRISETKDAGTGLVAVRWLQDKPHVNYLICLVAGHLKSLEDQYRDIPLALYTPASQIEYAANTFKDTKDMMAFFEQEIGVPYPWAKYFQVCVDDYNWGGMENTSLTVLNDNTLHTSASETLRSSQGLVAHELAHQWFGDLVTCKDWSHLWLNEGFATYYDALYEGHKHGRDGFLHQMLQNAQSVLNIPNQTNAMVRRDFNRPEEQFGYLAYPKGSWILHMLRSRLGDELYRRCIKTFLERHQFGNAVTEDLNAIIEELSGRSWDPFFDQYVYHAGHPELALNYSWDERNKLAKITVQQTQKLSDDVLLFQVPLPVRFKTGTNAIDRLIQVTGKAEEFYFALPAAPTVVRFDPELTLLARLQFSPPTPMLYAQLADKGDMLGRLQAVEQLGTRRDAGAVPRLKETLNSDGFYAVRLAASGALRGFNTDAAHDALRASTAQSDARVRQRVLRDLAGGLRDSTAEIALRVAREDKNPEMQKAAIDLLGAYPRPDARTLLLELLNSSSYRHELAGAALGALRAQDDPASIAPVLEALRRDEAKFESRAFGRALEALAWLARNEDKKDAVREFLAGHLRSKRPPVQLAAIRALGTLNDPRAVAALETFTTALKDTPERTASEKAVADLRAGKKPSAELGTLRGEVQTLQKENRDLRRDLDDLKKKMEALAPKPAPEKSGKKPTPARSPKG